ncbi:MAG: LruC domain-containing protein [Prevotellaceae bacterium]|jgi:hypothetical protein|nr:LruC domain-containing protein [Prevotellaceae bacterium]
MKRIAFLMTIATALLATSCQQDAYQRVPDDQKDFALSSKISVNIQTPPIDSAKVSIFTENPYNEYGDVVATPVLIGWTPVNKQITVPLSTAKLYVTIDGILRTFDRGDINYSGSILPEAMTKATTDASPITIDNGLWNKILNIYPEGVVNTVNGSLETCTDLVSQADNTEAWVSFLNAGGDVTCKIYYYVYQKDATTPPALSEENLIFDDVSNKNEPTLGTRKYLGTFNKGDIVGFAIKSSGEDGIKYSTPHFNSNPIVKTARNGANLVGATMGIIRSIEYMGVEYQIYGAEDFYGWADMDYNDILLLVQSNPPMKPMNELPSPDKEMGRTIREGIWIFEDNYPTEGDYDFNDVVVRYYIEEPDDSSNANVFLRVAAVGANFNNKFGINEEWLINSGLSGYKNVYIERPETETTIQSFVIPQAAEYDPKLNNGKNDISKDSENIYNANYPYVLDIPSFDAFQWCQETKRIDLAYPKYSSWVANGCGVIDSDWYKYPNTALTYSK